MGLLDELLGGGQRQAEYKDFTNRYQQGSPYDQIGDDETLQRYKELAPELSDADYRESAQESFSQLTPRSGPSSAAGSASGRGSRASRCRTTT